MIREVRQRGRERRSSIGPICGVTWILCASLAAQTPPDEGERALPVASNVALVFGGKSTTRGKIEGQLTPALREALDRWTPVAADLQLAIALGERPGHIVLGHAPAKTLADAAKWMDKSFDLLDPLVPLAEGRTDKVTIAVLVDADGVSAGVWGSVIDQLVADKLIVPAAAEALNSSVEGLTLRQVPLFLQPTYDVAGDASAGDDEFRLGNEVVHKAAQCLLTMRTGQQPPALMWGLGYVAEIKLFDSVYQFNTAGFVAAADHAGWSEDARTQLDERRKASSFSLARLAADDEAAGQAAPAQKLTWASLAYLAQKKPQELRAMWTDLAQAHTEADPTGLAPVYRGDRERTLEILRARLDAIDPAELSSFLKRGK